MKSKSSTFNILVFILFSVAFISIVIIVITSQYEPLY